MSDIFLPEGRLLNTPENCRQCASAAGLRRAMERQTILEGTALMAKPDLTLRVAVGPYIGEIPREETAEGIAGYVQCFDRLMKLWLAGQASPEELEQAYEREMTQLGITL